jgi:hypothetical protein
MLQLKLFSGANRFDPHTILGLLLKAASLLIRDQIEKSKVGISQFDALCSGC